MEWLALNALPFVLKHWRALLLAGLLLAGCLWWNAHVRADNAMEIRAIQAEADAVIYKSELARITAQLADADNAAKVAIAAKVEAEKAAAKKLAAERKKWARIYSSKPENKAWSESEIPPEIREALR